MSMRDKVAFVTTVSSGLTPDMLKTIDGQHTFSEENILSVALGAAVTDDRDEFEHMAGMYEGGYRSALREGLYHGRGAIPLGQWRKEIRRLYHIIRQHAEVKLPQLEERELEESIPSNLWKFSKY
jgi:hypothetical protein